MERRARTLVSFDMDGTLIRNTNSMELVGGLNGRGKEINEVFARIKGTERLNWVEGDAIMAEYMKGTRVDDIDAWFEGHAEIIGGLERLLRSMKENGVDAILVTSGPTEVAKCMWRRYPFQAAYGSEYEVRDGVMTGRISRHIMDHGGKYGCIQEYCAQHGLDPAQTIVVGDSYSDIEVFRKCRRSIALNGEEGLRDYAFREYRTEDIRNLLPQILLWRSAQ